MTKRERLFHEWFNLFALIWLIITEICFNAHCLKDLKIFVPEAVIMGNAATLSCQYDLEQAALYSVRWYFGTEEFYRYVPKETPPTLVFPVSGINVDLTNSDATSVTLKGVNRELTGNYQCEVSEDAPLFHTDIRAAHMQVIELPKDEPAMQVDKKVITLNDNFKAVCTVGPSYPPANITWYMNGRKIYKTPFQRISHVAHEGSATYSSLEIYPHSQVLQGFFQTVPKYQTTSILLLCEVSILHVFHKNVQQRLLLSVTPPTTISPNLLGLEGSKRINGGDPDNSALTGGGSSNLNSRQRRIDVLAAVIGMALLAILAVGVSQHSDIMIGVTTVAAAAGRQVVRQL
uniref:Ig-like domain-containing protein n=1 Tax=Ceratitis capitata TaxID=7213 RepID=W8BFK7_CERCA